MVRPCQSDLSSDPGLGICTVCMDEIEPDVPRSTTPCGHIFHFGCLALSMQTSHKCPLCRHDVLSGSDEASEGEDIELILSSDSSANGDIEIEISDVQAGDESFRRLLDTIGRVRSRSDVNIDLYVSEQDAPSPPPPCALPPTAGNIIDRLKEGDVTQVQNMLSHDATLARATDASGDTLLHLAVIRQNEYLVRYLATNVEMPVNCTNRARMTPLHYAVCTGDLRIVTLMLNLGCSVHATDCSGRTPLHHAVLRCDPRCLDYLLDRGAYVNAADMAGETALHYAGRSAWLHGVRRLATSRHCIVDAENCLGDTPLHMASSVKSSACSTFLIVSGANPVKKNKAGCAAVPV